MSSEKVDYTPKTQQNISLPYCTISKSYELYKDTERDLRFIAILNRASQEPNYRFYLEVEIYDENYKSPRVDVQGKHRIYMTTEEAKYLASERMFKTLSYIVRFERLAINLRSEPGFMYIGYDDSVAVLKHNIQIRMSYEDHKTFQRVFNTILCDLTIMKSHLHAWDSKCGPRFIDEKDCLHQMLIFYFRKLFLDLDPKEQTMECANKIIKQFDSERFNTFLHHSALSTVIDSDVVQRAIVDLINDITCDDVIETFHTLTYEYLFHNSSCDKCSKLKDMQLHLIN